MKLDFEEIILTGLKKAEFGEEKRIELYFLNQTRPNGSDFVNFVFFCCDFIFGCGCGFGFWAHFIWAFLRA